MKYSGKSRFGLSEATIQKINAVFATHPNVTRVILYGSRAKGTAKTGSDIDLVFLGDHLALDELMKIDVELDDLLLPYKFDLALYDRIKNPDLLEHMNRVGKIFYERVP